MAVQKNIGKNTLGDNKKMEVDLTYTHPEHIAYWLNIDAFKKDQYEPEPTQLSGTV